MSRFDNNCLWITGRVHDRRAILAFVGIRGGEGEIADQKPADDVGADVADQTDNFDFVDLFHGTGFGLNFGFVTGSEPSTRDKVRDFPNTVSRSNKTLRNFYLNLFRKPGSKLFFRVFPSVQLVWEAS